MHYGWLSVLPPLVAIGLAIATRRIVLSLTLGVFCGALLLDPNWAALRAPAASEPTTDSQQPAAQQPAAQQPAAQQPGAQQPGTQQPGTQQPGTQQPGTQQPALWRIPLRSTVSFFEDHLWTSLSDQDHLRVFCFTLLMGAMIGVIHRSGGMHAVVRGLAPLARGRTGGQLLTWTLGLIVFIDDYANSLLLGNTMRPLTDRLGISREKLAYLVDSTAAPVSGLAVVSTWVAGEIGYIEAGFANLGLESAPSGFAIFVETIPYRFYVLWALLFVPLIALLGRDFGPMLTAERRRIRQGIGNGEPDGQRDGQREGEHGGDDISERSQGQRVADDPAALLDIPHRWYNAVVPIGVTLLATLGLMAATGYASVDQQALAEGPWKGLIAIVGNANSYIALVYGSLVGLATASALVLVQRLLSPRQLRSAAFDGARLVIPSLTILWLAWALSGTTDSQHLGTGEYLAGLIRDPRPPAWLPAGFAEAIRQLLTPRWMPTIVFVLASLVAFSTGTSWGTMGILMPIVVSTTYTMLADQGDADPRHPLMIATIGSVLAGAIFGDHCSPISDTTVLSAQASGCDHLAHVRTQMPYALYVAAISIVCGTIPVGLGAPLGLILIAGFVVMAVGLLLMGRRP